MVAQHDEHFLQRLHRLEGEHAELAMGLYYDHMLVERILAVAEVPDAVERVALCLGEPDRGPHLIVSRDGHFVTALAEDMSLQPDQFVISRYKLDAISEELDSLRGLAAEAKAGGRRTIRRRFERIYEAGPGLSREEFDELVRWLPLMRMDLLLNQMDMIERCHLLIEKVSGRGRAGRRQRQLTHEYWKASWAAAHLSLLLGGDGALELRKLLEALDYNDEGVGLTMVWTMIRLGASSFAMRGTWLASKMPTLIVPHAKRRYLGEEKSLLSTVTDSLSLSAVALRHQKYRAEVAKVLARGAELDGPFQPVRNVANVTHEHNSQDPEAARELVLDYGRRFLSGAYAQVGVSDPELLEQLDPAIGLALVMMIPEPFCKEVTLLSDMYLRLPWLVGVEARDFYLPESHVDMVRGPYNHSEGKVLTEARLAALVHKAEPARREGPKVGRNQPCPCGSGKKYKRCCLE